MARMLMAALVGVTMGVGCTDTPVESRADAATDELFGEVLEVARSPEAGVVVSLGTADGTVWVTVGSEARISVGGFVIPPTELADYIGFSGAVVCQKQGDVCRETRFIGLEPRPPRKE